MAGRTVKMCRLHLSAATGCGGSGTRWLEFVEGVVLDLASVSAHAQRGRRVDGSRVGAGGGTAGGGGERLCKQSILVAAVAALQDLVESAAAAAQQQVCVCIVQPFRTRGGVFHTVSTHCCVRHTLPSTGSSSENCLYRCSVAQLPSTSCVLLWRMFADVVAVRPAAAA